MKINYSVLSLCVLLLVSCAKELNDGGENVLLKEDALSTKVVKFSEEYSRGNFLVKLSSASDAILLSEMDGVSSVEKLFPENASCEQLRSQFGLDRWYEVELSENADVDKVIRNAAALDCVSVAEYNCVATRASDCKVYPYNEEESADTKADVQDGEFPFNDPSLKAQWHYYNRGDLSMAAKAKKGADINVRDVWRNLTAGDPSIIVAVVDEGVKNTHPDLKDNIWVNKKEIPGNGIDDDGNGYIDDVYGYNFQDKTGTISWDKEQDSGHGTHCAGTIAAVNNNGVGVSGVAGGTGNGDGCRVMSCQIFSNNAGGYASSTAKAIAYAAENGASIISCSFGYTKSVASDDAYYKMAAVEIDAIQYFEAFTGNNPVLDGNIAVFAAGNESHPYAHYPGAFHNIISVTAFAPDFLPTYYTNYGPGCNIIAPGGEAYLARDNVKAMVLSTVPSELPELQEDVTNVKGANYGYMQGTSMACPHVSGIVALGLSYAKKIGKKFTVEEFKNLIITSAVDMDSNLQGTKTYAYYQKDLNLAQFYHKLGTGAIDTWQFLMQIEGIPSIAAEVGKEQWLDLSPYFGTASKSLTYIGEPEVSEGDSSALGLAAKPYIKYGRLYIHPTKFGSGKVTIRAVGGGDSLGGGSNPPGGMEISHEISIITRPFAAKNGGWL